MIFASACGVAESAGVDVTNLELTKLEHIAISYHSNTTGKNNKAK